jgi:hypothetical protein
MSLFTEICSSFTLSGKRCSKPVSNNTKFCSLHQSNNRGPKLQCEAITKNGTRCIYKCKIGNLCDKHKPKTQQECKGLNIANLQLEKCKKKCNNEYCEDHKYKYRLEKPDECPICMDTISDITEIPLSCGHWIHKNCLKSIVNYKCPICRQSIKKKEKDYILGENTDINDNNNNDNDFIEQLEIMNYNIINSIDVHDLQPVDDDTFLNGIKLLFVNYSNRYNFIVNEQPHNYYENINYNSFFDVIYRDNDRYNVFLSTVIKNIVSSYISSQNQINTAYCIIRNEILLDYSVCRDLNYLFNIVNYNIDIINASFQLCQFENIVMNYIETLN